MTDCMDGAIAYDLRTEDVKLSERITALERRVDALERHSGEPGVLIRRWDGHIQAEHITVLYTPLLDAAAAIDAMQTRNVVFVKAADAGKVLDALGVTEDDR